MTMAPARAVTESSPCTGRAPTTSRRSAPPVICRIQNDALVFDPRTLDEADYPVVMGLAAGHGQENLLLPFGVDMALNTTAATLSIVESPLA